MRIICILLSVVLSGCIVDEYDYNIVHNDVLYVGDSLCYKVWDVEKESMDKIKDDKDQYRTAQRELGIVINCVPGRKSIDIEQVPDRNNGDPWRILFIALGTNDTKIGDIEAFRLQYQTLVYTANSDIIYCVLPNKTVLGVDSEPYRQVIRDTCSNVIDPLNAGVKFRAKDTVHMTKADHFRWKVYLRDILRLEDVRKARF